MVPDAEITDAVTDNEKMPEKDENVNINVNEHSEIRDFITHTIMRVGRYLSHCSYKDPVLWFGMIESTFELAVPKPITDERTKYNYCVAHLSPDTAMAVRDVIRSPGSLYLYSKLKDEVIV
ncbi:uncharacterized protein TNCV_1363851 [Trichonephila clavipes]|uniref:DUF7041 domain-containing protein n=1 Tax=Trichonephila clavipes TaxID=2585209 RepID=A0A8X6V6D1_TRICX|nr:uncharacterized protein TNCV_1363851 [Trichonephila clavipes]